MKIFFIIILFIPLISFSQLHSSVDLSIGSSYTYRHFTNKASLSLRKSEETGKFNWQMGIGYNLKIKKQLFLRTGIKLKRMGYKEEKRTDIRWPSEFVGGVYTRDPSLAHEIQILRDYLFVEIPLGLRYEMKNKGIGPFWEVAISPSYYLINQVKEKTDIGNSTDNTRNDFLNSLYLSTNLSFGYIEPLGSNYELFQQIVVHYQITGLSNEENESRKHLFGMGLEIGIRKILN